MYNNPNDVLKIAKDALDKAIETEKKSKAFMASVGPAIISALQPSLRAIENALSGMKVTVNPEMRIPPITVPAPKYTPPDVIVNYTPPKIDIPFPKIDLSTLKIPELKWPKGNMPITGRVSLMDVNINNPLPVQLRDAKGNPVSLGGGGATIMGGGGFREVNVTIVGSNGSLAAALVDSSGNQYDGSNPLPTTLSSTSHLDVQQLSGSIDSVNVQQFAGNPAVAGGGYQDNAIRVVHATDAVVSVNIVSENVVLEVRQVSGGVDSTQNQLIAMTTNPSAVSDAAVSFQKSDKLGRALSRPMQVRELVATAYATLSTGTEATLITAAAGTYLDLIYIMGANTSTAAVQIDIRNVSAGNVVMSLEIPANGTVGIACPVPLPQDATGNAWTVDMPDITNSNVLITALFSKEI